MSDRLLGGLGVAMVLCCAVAPAALGAVAGSVLGGWLGVAAACLVAVTVVLLLRVRGRSRC